MRELTTDRLVLRQWQPEDVDFLLDMYSRWEVHHGRTDRFYNTTCELLVAEAAT